MKNDVIMAQLCYHDKDDDMDNSDICVSCQEFDPTEKFGFIVKDVLIEYIWNVLEKTAENFLCNFNVD